MDYVNRKNLTQLSLTRNFENSYTQIYGFYCIII